MFKRSTAVRFIGVLITFLIMSPSSHAGTSTGVITNITVSNFSNSISFIAGVHINKPACASTTVNYWSFPLNDLNAKPMYALLLSAAAQGKTITVVGITCDGANASGYPSAININY